MLCLNSQWFEVLMNMKLWLPFNSYIVMADWIVNVEVGMEANLKGVKIWPVSFWLRKKSCAAWNFFYFWYDKLEVNIFISVVAWFNWNSIKCFICSSKGAKNGDFLSIFSIIIPIFCHTELSALGTYIALF